MPNHLHGIIEITKTNHEENNESELCFDDSFDAIRNHFDSKTSPSSQCHQFQYVIPRSIASIVRGYKIGVTKWMRNNTDIHQVWQRNYYEHIIRNKKSYFRITRYIRNNPSNWDSSE
nr:hypothetical protein [Saprospiraceae bacterium]